MSIFLREFNYAQAIGIHSLGGAIVFAVLYAFLLAVFGFKSLTHPIYIHYVLTLFCVIRFVAFTIRAVLAGSKTAGDKLSLIIAELVLSQVGFFPLLYSAYTLVLDRTVLMSDLKATNHPILKFTQDRRIFRILLLAGVVVGINAATRTNGSGVVDPTQRALRIASVTIFLFLTVVQALQTVILASAPISGRSQYYIRGKDSIGIRYGNHILLMISVLLLIREIFSIATVTKVKVQENEHFWYPFVSLPEILIVLLYTTRGLIPKGDDLANDNELTTTSYAPPTGAIPQGQHTQGQHTHGQYTHAA